MAEKKISELTAKGAAVAATDLMVISEVSGASYVTKSVTGANIKSLAQSGLPTEIQLAASDETTALTTGTAKVTLTILSTKLTIDNTEKTSTTAATPAVISDSALSDDSEITIDIDQIGNGSAKGLKVTLIGTRV